MAVKFACNVKNLFYYLLASDPFYCIQKIYAIIITDGDLRQHRNLAKHRDTYTSFPFLLPCVIYK